MTAPAVKPTPILDKLELLSSIIDKLPKYLFQQDETQLYAQLVSDCALLFEAESVAIFRVDDAKPRELNLMAQSSDPNSEDPPKPFEPVNLLIPDDPDEPKCGLTGWCVATEAPIINLSGSELVGHHAVKGEPTHDNLKSGNCHSLLAMRLQVKDGRPLGLLKVENKRGPESAFTVRDEFFARILATKVAAQIDTRRLIVALRKLTEEGHTCHDASDYYAIVLKTAKELLRCDHAMLALLDLDQGDVCMAATTIESPTNDFHVLPRPSIMRRCWDQPGQNASELLDDVGITPNFIADYHVFHEKTRSEAAIRLDWEGVRFGVLNVESDRPGHFDESDLETLRSLVPFIAASYRAVDKESHFLHILRELGTYGSSHRSILQHLLQIALTSFGFANGHIFVPTSDDTELVLMARVGPKDVVEADIPRFKLDGQFDSLQKRVFYGIEDERTGEIRDHYFCIDATKDTLFDPKGREVLQISGPYLALRLMAEGKPVGVLSVWGDADAKKSRQPEEADKDRLKHYANVAAEVVAVAGQHSVLNEAIRKAIPTLQSPARPEEVWPKVLRLVQQYGFDRVRLYRFHHEGEYFEMVAANGTDNPAVGSIINAHQKGSPYAYDIVMRSKTKQDVIQYPNDALGPDPDAGWLGRPAGLPWIVIPLVCHGRLYGQIAADNAVSRKPFREVTLENLEMIGSVAALTVAQAETLGRLTWTSLDKLHAAIRYEDTERAVLRKLLVYLTDGSAFGFSRAGFFQYDATLKRFGYTTGLGSPTEGRFREVAGIATTNGIEYNFAHAEEHNDPELDTIFSKHAIAQSDFEKIGFRPTDPAAIGYGKVARSDWPEWMLKLAIAIDSSGPTLVPVVGTENRVYGLFVVDREWQDRPLTDADVHSLTNFGRHAALLLGQRDAAERAIVAQRGDVWKDVSMATSHRINTPISTLETEIETLKTVFKNISDPIAHESLANMTVAISNAKRMSNQFNVLRDIYRRDPTVPPSSSRLVRILNTANSNTADPKVNAEIQCPADLDYHGYSAGLEECVSELFNNAKHWAKRGNNLVPMVTVWAEEMALSYHQSLAERKYIRIVVNDNGPGMNAKKFVKIGQGITDSTRKGGSGFGLFFVWEIARALEGFAIANNSPGVGMQFELTLPQIT